MGHPFFKNSKTFLYYSLTWILVTGIHFVVLLISGDSMIGVLIADSLVFNGTYFIMGLVLWYIVRYSKSGRQNALNIFVNHLTNATIVTAIWIGTAFLLMRLLYPGQYHLLMESIPWRIITGIFFYLIIVLVYYILIYYNDLQERLETENKLRELVKQTELDVLKAQINPHFLFNSLNSISSLTITNPGKAQEMIIKLSDFLRYSVSQPADQFTNLKKEIENIKRYLDIEQVRFGNRLAYSIDANQFAMDALIPALILQPLYENAIKHGVYESTETIFINTVCELKENILEITISNNFDPDAKSRKGEGIGLKNTRERMKLIYKNEQLVKISSEKDQFKVTLAIPQNFKR
jgi:sensor histidine kinase YesM